MASQGSQAETQVASKDVLVVLGGEKIKVYEDEVGLVRKKEDIVPYRTLPLKPDRIMRIGKANNRFFVLYNAPEKDLDLYAFYVEPPPSSLTEIDKLEYVKHTCPDGRRAEWDVEGYYCDCCPRRGERAVKTEVLTVWKRPENPPPWSAAKTQLPLPPPERIKENWLYWDEGLRLFIHYAKQILNSDNIGFSLADEHGRVKILVPVKKMQLGPFTVEEGLGAHIVHQPDPHGFDFPLIVADDAGYYATVWARGSEFYESWVKLRDPTKEEAKRLVEEAYKRRPWGVYTIAESLAKMYGLEDYLKELEHREKVERVKKVWSELQSGKLDPLSVDLDVLENYGEDVYRDVGINKEQFINTLRKLVEKAKREKEERERREREMRLRRIEEGVRRLQQKYGVAVTREEGRVGVRIARYLPREEFDEIIRELRSMGFRFDKNKKTWFIAA